ncbi:shikimate dehydrogenase [bacterium E08(2017)]|nr:shikimate dehydrogenase [bacterium E08(2017)]
MRLSGHTTPFAVLGHPIGHSLSPVMHNASIESLGMDAIYLAFDVEPSLLMETLPAMRNLGFEGVNLTVPLKEVAYNGIDKLDDSARILGAVNTVQFLDDNTMVGHNTDGKGFLLSLKEDLDCTPEGLKVFMLGSGGAGRAVALTCAMNGASSVMVTDIDDDRSAKLASEINELAPGVTTAAVSSDAQKDASLEADLIVQASPVGMNPSDTPLLHADAFRNGQMLFDLVYMYPETGIMKLASDAGAKTANGLGMLMHQGAYAFKIWTGKDADTAVMRQALENEVYKND